MSSPDNLEPLFEKGKEAWAGVDDATEWVETLRGNSAQASPDFSLIFVVDVETGGLNERESPLLEIGIEHLQTGERIAWPIRSPLTKWVNWCPWLAKRLGVWCDPESMAINGRNPEHGMALGDALRAMGIFINKHTPPDFPGSTKRIILAGMNPSFDLRFLKRAHWIAGSKFFPFSHRTIDLHTLALKQALEHGETIANLSTTAIYARNGQEPEAKPHQALEGVRREAHLFRDLLRNNGNL